MHFTRKGAGGITVGTREGSFLEPCVSNKYYQNFPVQPEVKLANNNVQNSPTPLVPCSLSLVLEEHKTRRIPDTEQSVRLRCKLMDIPGLIALTFVNKTIMETMLPALPEFDFKWPDAEPTPEIR